MSEGEGAKLWVLLRRDKPRVCFFTREAAQKFFDGLRFNGPRQPDAALFGPAREAWYCHGGREGVWGRDDERRRRERKEEDAASEEDAR